MKIYIASDHAGFELKEAVKNYLISKKYDIDDQGTYTNESTNWVVWGAKVAQKVSDNPNNSRAIIICGSGIGMSIVSNKFKNVRAALCNDEYAAEMSRKHNNANILNLGERIITTDRALRIINVWLNTEFDGGRHQERIDYLHNIIEKNNFK